LRIDERVVLGNVPWDVYQGLQAAKGEGSALRAHYLHGQLELMSPSDDHEWIKTLIGLLLFAWSEIAEVDLNGFGSWTVERKGAERAAEADQCYILGNRRKRRPDIAIEVEWTPGGLDKLEVWRGLRVPEVWLWRRGKIEVYTLTRGRYVRVAHSGLLPNLDLTLATKFIRKGPQRETIRRYREALSASEIGPGRPRADLQLASRARAKNRLRLEAGQ
jgi:Uma2 family endonuclease